MQSPDRKELLSLGDDMMEDSMIQLQTAQVEHNPKRLLWSSSTWMWQEWETKIWTKKAEEHWIWRCWKKLWNALNCSCWRSVLVCILVKLQYSVGRKRSMAFRSEEITGTKLENVDHSSFAPVKKVIGSPVGSGSGAWQTGGGLVTCDIETWLLWDIRWKTLKQWEHCIPVPHWSWDCCCTHAPVVKSCKCEPSHLFCVWLETIKHEGRRCAQREAVVVV